MASAQEVLFSFSTDLAAIQIHAMQSRRTHFLFLHGAHDKGTRFLFLTTLYCPSGEYCPELEAVAEGGVGVIAENWVGTKARKIWNQF